MLHGRQCTTEYTTSLVHGVHNVAGPRSTVPTVYGLANVPRSTNSVRQGTVYGVVVQSVRTVRYSVRRRCAAGVYSTVPVRAVR